jgi:hypothetical protein
MKKTALQQLIQWGEQMMSEHPLKVLSFAEAIDKAEELLELEKEQIIDAYNNGENRSAELYYNETYKGGDK